MQDFGLAGFRVGVIHSTNQVYAGFCSNVHDISVLYAHETVPKSAIL
jgi:hypothetical protein